MNGLKLSVNRTKPYQNEGGEEGGARGTAGEMKEILTGRWEDDDRGRLSSSSLSSIP